MGVFGDGQAVAGQRGAGRAVGIQRVRFALPAPNCPIGASDLDDMNIVGLQGLRQSCAVAAGALHADSNDLTEATRPAEPRPIARRVGPELGIAEHCAGIGDRGQMDGVEVGVGADDDATLGCHDGFLSVQ